MTLICCYACNTILYFLCASIPWCALTVKVTVQHKQQHPKERMKHKITNEEIIWLLFLLWQYKYTYYLDFWLCACAFSTLTTIFCSSIRKARLILGKRWNSVRYSYIFWVYTSEWQLEILVSPVTDTLRTHRASIGPADVLLGLGEPHQNLRSNSTNLTDRAQKKKQFNFSLKTNLTHII